MRDANSTAARVRIPIEQFGRYLRSGLWRQPDEVIELKFNPMHDPATGRFTFRGGGGGSFAGGGATGNWDSSSPKKAGGSTPPKQQGVSAVAAVAQAALLASTRKASLDQVVVRNNYSYTLDSDDRTISVTGTLSLRSDPERSRSAQAVAGGGDRLPTDDGGHYVAVRFDGPTDRFNHFAQDANFNRGGYRVLEDGWAKDMRLGKQVYIEIAPTYYGSSKRPSSINVTYPVNDVRRTRFANSAKGKFHGN